MTVQTRAQILDLISSALADNSVGGISEADVRAVNANLADSALLAEDVAGLPITTATQAALDLKSALSHTHIISDVAFGAVGADIAATETLTEFYGAAGIEDLPPSVVASALIGLDADRILISYSWSDVVLELDGVRSFSGLDEDVTVVGDFTLSNSGPDLIGWRRVATGTCALTGVSGVPLSELDEPRWFYFVQDATGGRAFTVSGLSVVNDVDVATAANAVTVFMLFRVAGVDYIKRIGLAP